MRRRHRLSRDNASLGRAPNHRRRDATNDDPNDARATRHYRDATSDAHATDDRRSVERTNYFRSSDGRTTARSRNTTGSRIHNRTHRSNHLRRSNPEAEAYRKEETELPKS